MYFLLVAVSVVVSASAVDCLEVGITLTNDLLGVKSVPSVAGPRAWNQLSLRHTGCVATFKRHLKTLLFPAAYGVTDN